MNLSTGAKAPPPAAAGVSVVRSRLPASPGAPALAPLAGRALSQSHLAQSLVEMFRAAESDIPSSRDSDDSAEDDDGLEEEEDEEDEEDSDSDDSPSGPPLPPPRPLTSPRGRHIKSLEL